MKNGDYTLRSVRPTKHVAITNPFTFSPFQCDGAGNANPALADGTQASGVDCNKIPANMIDPVGQRMIDLYPVSNASNAALGYNYTNVPVRKLNEGERMPASITASPATIHSLPVSATIRRCRSFPAVRRALPSRSFASTQNITNHGRNAAMSETHIFNERTINQLNLGFNRIFNHI